MANFIYHTTVITCPVCGRAEDCRTNAENGLVHCRHSTPTSSPPGYRYIKPDASGFLMFAPDDYTARPHKKTDFRNPPSTQPAKRKNKSTSDVWDDIKKNKRPMTAEERERLSVHLCLPLAVHDLLGTEVWEGYFGHNRDLIQYVTPERDGNGNSVGCSRRPIINILVDQNGNEIKLGKKSSGHRGIYYANNWLDVDDDPASPIFIVEGASDTAASIVLGLNAIGRPNNLGGAQHIITLLENNADRVRGRTIVIVGENDQGKNPDGSIRWPGREGAEHVATQLAERFNTTVYVAMPPAGYKDVRTIIESAKLDLQSNRVTLTEIGQSLKLYLLGALETVSPNSRKEAQEVFTASLPKMNFKAADFYTTADPYKSAAAAVADIQPCKHCPHPKGVIHEHVANRLSAVFWFPCKALDCVFCEKKKRGQYCATVEKHLGEYGRTNTTALVYWCPVAEWKAVSKGIRDHNGRYFRIDPGFGSYLIVATVKPTNPDRVSGLEEMPVATAIARMCSAVMAVPKLRRRGFDKSREWNLVGEDKDPQWKGWTRVAKINCTQAAAFEILEHHQTAWQPMNSDKGYWPWHGWTWKTPLLTDDKERIYADLREGSVIPDLSWEQLGFGTAPGLDGASQPFEIFSGQDVMNAWSGGGGG